MLDADQPSIPFVIGVTGPIAFIRDLPPIERSRLRQLVKDQFLRVLNDPKVHARWVDGQDAAYDPPRLPNTPLLVITNGAGGFDELVTEAVRELAGSGGMPISVLPILPFAPAGTSTADAVVLPPLDEKGLQSSAPQERAAATRMQYAFAGLCIARWARLILTVDDDRDPTTRDVRSTRAQILEMALNGTIDDPLLVDHLRALPDPLREHLGVAPNALELFEPCPVVCLPIDGRSITRSYLRFLPPSRFEGGGDQPERRRVYRAYFMEACARLDAFNRDLHENSRREGYPIEDDPPPELRGVHRLFVLTDGAAGTRQARFRATRTRIHVAVFLAALLFVLSTHWFGAWQHDLAAWSLAGYVILALLADRAFGNARAARIEPRALDSRAVAEGLRVHYAWRRAGIAQPVTRHYLGHQRNELAWIRHAFEAVGLCELRLLLSGWPSRPGDHRLTASLRRWLAGQLHYYVDQHNQRETLSLSAENQKHGFLAASLLAAFVASLAGTHGALGIALALAATILLVGALHRRTVDYHQLQSLRSPPEQRVVFRSRVGAALVVAATWAAVWWAARTVIFGATDSTSREAVIHHAWILAIVLPALAAAFIHTRAESAGWAAECRRFRQMITVYENACARLCGLDRQPIPPPQPPTHATRENLDRFAAELDARAKVMGEALERADATDRLAAAQTILVQVGRESLAEHAEWLMLHRDRPLDLPHAV